MRGRLLLYGATGYTGRLIARRVKAEQLNVVLAARRTDSLRALAESLDLPYRVIELDQPSRFATALQDVNVVLNAAGPFENTALPIAEACLKTRTHYLDVAGELPVFRMLHAYDVNAKTRGVMIMPGVGFAILATDCLAAHVARALPTSHYLRLGISRPDSFSRGTLKTMLGMVRDHVTIRRRGRLTSVPVGRLERTFDYGGGATTSTAVNWADVYTAYYTTGIPNIETYAEADVLARTLYQFGGWLAQPMRMVSSRELMNLAMAGWPEGPSQAERSAASRVIVAEAEDQWRRRACVRLETPDGYTFTAAVAVGVAKRVLAGDWSAGFQTPARVYGPDFVLAFEGVTRKDIGKPSGA